ncbi:FimB/Mfa2 family fimbrial subunit [Bacteroides thetaiotaomicron]|uniref:FimB/Mfa2 family fimbrial subunit n=1 Tax=Bacteroides thetaiotaomicron TaxID=818 RepID=UPI0018A1159B|nr:FimB/Mfa2 family fimbrial subunit [Bacteroides thetaiotaomicron]MDC2175181.1 FimB/Mfa2 family fimbrial subunit [Bacteroides thetaiotaomicron]MDC2190824.1 FimB/Mfa2 family fimbrial subunit [Bacteroides thetaiotaomicron]
MKQRKTKIALCSIMTLLGVAFSITSCIREDRSDCMTEFTFTVKAYGSSGAELTSEEVGDVRLFVFNGSTLRLVECINTHIGEVVTISSFFNEDIHIVGWGNLEGGAEKCAEMIPGSHKNQGKISLLPFTRGAYCACTPDDLFRGEISVFKSEQEGNKIIPIKREVGSMRITVRSLKLPGSTLQDEDFRILVKETGSLIDFYGTVKGDKIYYSPLGSFVTNAGREEYYTPPFNMLPEPEGVTVEVYRDGQLLASVSKDKLNNPIAVNKDLLTNVVIDLSGSVSVTMSITEWGNEQMGKEF